MLYGLIYNLNNEYYYKQKFGSRTIQVSSGISHTYLRMSISTCKNASNMIYYNDEHYKHIHFCVFRVFKNMTRKMIIIVYPYVPQELHTSLQSLATWPAQLIS